MPSLHCIACCSFSLCSILLGNINILFYGNIGREGARHNAGFCFVICFTAIIQFFGWVNAQFFYYCWCQCVQLMQTRDIILRFKCRSRLSLFICLFAFLAVFSFTACKYLCFFMSLIQLCLQMYWPCDYSTEKKKSGGKCVCPMLCTKSRYQKYNRKKFLKLQPHFVNQNNLDWGELWKHLLWFLIKH